MSPTPQNYPALFSTLAQAVLALIIATGLTSLTAGQAGVIEAAVSAGAGLVVALMVHEFSVPVLTGFVSAVVTALVAFGVPHVTPQLTSLVSAVIVALAGFFVHSQATPRTRPASLMA